jgi:hypothetical protein
MYGGMVSPLAPIAWMTVTHLAVYSAHHEASLVEIPCVVVEDAQVVFGAFEDSVPLRQSLRILAFGPLIVVGPRHLHPELGSLPYKLAGPGCTHMVASGRCVLVDEDIGHGSQIFPSQGESTRIHIKGLSDNRLFLCGAELFAIGIVFGARESSLHPLADGAVVGSQSLSGGSSTLKSAIFDRFDGQIDAGFF